MTAGQTTVIITNVGQTCLSYHTVPVCSHASVHTYVCVIAYACVFFFLGKNKTALSQHAWWW